MKKINKIILFLIICFFSINNLFAVETSNNESEILDSANQEYAVEEEIVKIKDVKDINKANVVVLEALNKITAKSYKYEVKIGDKIEFERLIVEPLFCWKSSPADIPENKVLLKIIENKLDKTTGEIFYGWMFSSSPSISTLEHPMYDIKIVDCKQVDETGESLGN